ncbi:MULTISPECIES: hypothetical protein [unclassified Streptomyces]|uniref:hypothetical protein n=1 Tax=unclassified Streptomyces TaxID=2593676 RepID=UPI0033D94BBE
MRARTALAALALAATSLLGGAATAVADAGYPQERQDRPKYVVSAVNSLGERDLPPCYRDLYATPSATICF